MRDRGRERKERRQGRWVGATDKERKEREGGWEQQKKRKGGRDRTRERGRGVSQAKGLMFITHPVVSGSGKDHRV